MDADDRRQEILAALRQSSQPISASALAGRFAVSRQVIVGDVALLRACGAEIDATPRGYILGRPAGLTRTVACRHAPEKMGLELYAVVDRGCTVLDVIVDHPLYGQLTGPLRLGSRWEVDRFLARCRSAEAQPLSLLTEGIHLHTLLCSSQAAYEAVLEALRALGVLLEE